jgi:hypothetical protein
MMQAATEAASSGSQWPTQKEKAPQIRAGLKIGEQDGRSPKA